HADEIGRARQASRVRRQEPIGAAHVKLLSEVIMSDHTVTARYDTVFHHAYAVEQPELRRLYEQAKRDQWNVSRDIDWSRSVDPDSAIVADELIDVYGTPYWERLGAAARAARAGRAQSSLRRLAAERAALRRARRHARLQPAGGDRLGPGREILRGDAGRRRGAPHRGDRPLHAGEAGGTHVPDAPAG